MAAIVRLKDSVYQHAASYGLPPDFHDFMTKIRFAPGQGTITGRTALTGNVVHVTDVLDDPDFELVEAMKKNWCPHGTRGALAAGRNPDRRNCPNTPRGATVH